MSTFQLELTDNQKNTVFAFVNVSIPELQNKFDFERWIETEDCFQLMSEALYEKLGEHAESFDIESWDLVC